MADEKVNILLITGSYPPKVCGVGDYTFKLLSYLKQSRDFSFDVFIKSEWSLKFFPKYLKALKATKSDFFHLQYPTEGYGYSMVPLLLIAFLPRKKTIVTVHELSNRNFLAYVYTLMLIFFARKVIVSNELERKHTCRFLLNKHKVVVIPIASNIKASEFASRKMEDRTVDLACFGHIRPLKGIEDFIETVSILPGEPKALIIGQSLKKYEDYFTDIKQKSDKMNIEVIANREEPGIADILANVKIAYLPFPDGVSNRRGSLLACIQNGCVIITRPSKFEQFNVFFSKYCYLVETNEEAGALITDLLKSEYSLKNTSNIIKTFSWQNVVKEHFALYNA